MARLKALIMEVTANMAAVSRVVSGDRNPRSFYLHLYVSLFKK